MVRIWVCGRVAVERDGEPVAEKSFPGRQGRTAFAYLVLERHRAVPRDELADAIWGSVLPASWQGSLSAIVSKLRRVLTRAGLPGALASSFGCDQLHLPSDVWIDVEAAAAAVREAENTLDADPARAADLAASARTVLTGELVPGGDGLWLDGHRRRIRETTLRTLELEASALLSLGDARSALAAARQASAIEPFRESSYRLQMRAAFAGGDRAEALRVWERCRSLLVSELGADPSPATEAVYLQVMRAVEPQAAPSGVVTFLATDIVRSTELWEARTQAMAEALQRHDEVIAGAVQRHGGTVVKAKGEGDATLSVFRRATDAAAAGLAVQDNLGRELWPAGIALRVRIAIHSGEAFERDNDYYGPAVNRAVALRSVADGGQTVLSGTAADLVRDHLADGEELIALGERDLPRLANPERVYEIRPRGTDPTARWVADVEAPGLALPRALVPPERFVGRDIELERLVGTWKEVTEGARRCVLVSGEPGIGKTALVSRLAAHAHAGGSLVLYGRCDEGLNAPYQPFVEALSRYAAEARELPDVGSDLVTLVPELRHRVAATVTPAPADPESERHRLFGAVAGLLEAESERRSVLLVLDDLHWAAQPTTLLVRHLFRADRAARVLVVATYRHTEPGSSPYLESLLADLARSRPERIRLTGLSPTDVAAYVPDVFREMAPNLHAHTHGNPFFLASVVAGMREADALPDVPSEVSDVVLQRVARLGPQTEAWLRVAAVAGREFDVDVVSAAAGAPEDRVVDACESALSAGVLTEVHADRYAFVHDIAHRVLYDDLSATRRVRMHRLVAEAMEALRSQDPPLAELAHHFAASARRGDASSAVTYLIRSGDMAYRRVAFEDAAQAYARALELLEWEADVPARQRYDALLGLGRSRQALGSADARSALVDAASIAVGMGDGEAIGRAALAIGEPRTSMSTGGWDADLTHLLQEAISCLPDEDSAMRARLLARLGNELVHSPRAGSRFALAEQAIGMARRVGDPVTLAECLLWAPPPTERLEDRRAMIEEALELAVRSSDGALELWARVWLGAVLVEMGELERFDRERAAFARRLDELGLRPFRMYVPASQAMRALLDGDLDGAEGLATQALQLAGARLIVLYALYIFAIRREQSRLDEILSHVDDQTKRTPELASHAALVIALAELDDADAARRAFERAAVSEFADLPVGATRLLTGAMVSEACALVGDAPRASTLYELLRDSTGRFVHDGGGVICFGSFDRYLGLLAATTQRWHDAEHHFALALKANELAGAKVWTIRTKLDLAAMHVRRNERGRAAHLLQDVVEEAERLSMVAVARRAAILARSG